jgi:hypothetical protein
MPDLLKQILIILLTGAFFSVVGISFRKFLTKKGIAQDRVWDIVALSFFIALIYQVWFQELSWKWLVILGLAGVILGANRMDFWYAANRDDWWWKSNNTESKNENKLSGE